MEKTIFETHDRFPKKVFDSTGLILDFNRQNLNLIRTADGDLTRLNKSDSWICVLTDKKMIERARNHKSFKKNFWVVNEIPSKMADTIAVSGPKTSVKQPSQMESIVKEMKEKAMRYGELKTIVLKSDGSYYASAKPNQIEEFEKLKKELNEE